MLEGDTWLLEALAEDIPGIADRILTNSKQFLQWCRKRQVISVNPIADITASEDLQIEKANEARTLTDEEIRLVLRVIPGRYWRKRAHQTFVCGTFSLQHHAIPSPLRRLRNGSLVNA